LSNSKAINQKTPVSNIKGYRQKVHRVPPLNRKKFNNTVRHKKLEQDNSAFSINKKEQPYDVFQLLQGQSHPNYKDEIEKVVQSPHLNDFMKAFK